LRTLSPDERGELYEALSLADADLDRRCPVQMVSTGHSKVMIGITSRDKLNRMVPDN